MKVDKYGLLAVGGSAHTVSIGGYMLGGGHSPMTRMLGLGVDSILEITLVTAQGDIVTATNTCKLHKYGKITFKLYMCSEGDIAIVKIQVNYNTTCIIHGDIVAALGGGGVTGDPAPPQEKVK